MQDLEANFYHTPLFSVPTFLTFFIFWQVLISECYFKDLRPYLRTVETYRYLINKNRNLQEVPKHVPMCSQVRRRRASMADVPVNDTAKTNIRRSLTMSEPKVSSSGLQLIKFPNRIQRWAPVTFKKSGFGFAIVPVGYLPWHSTRLILCKVRHGYLFANHNYIFRIRHFLKFFVWFRNPDLFRFVSIGFFFLILNYVYLGRYLRLSINTNIYFQTQLSFHHKDTFFRYFQSLVSDICKINQICIYLDMINCRYK